MESVESEPCDDAGERGSSLIPSCPLPPANFMELINPSTIQRNTFARQSL